MANLCGIEFGKGETFESTCLLVPDHPEPHDFTPNGFDKLFVDLQTRKTQFDTQRDKLFARFDQQLALEEEETVLV
jgi:hypothetical protein